MTTTIFLLIAGFVFLIVGAESLVKGASRLAASLGISPLIVGLTVVSFGTSSPELAVNIKAALAGQSGIGVGNVVGSNICNVLLILGLSALVAPLTVSQQLIKIDVPIMIAISFLTLLFAINGNISTLEGFIFFGLLIAYIVFLIFQSRKESKAIEEEYDQEFGQLCEPNSKNFIKNGLLVVVGIILLTIGSRWLVTSATTIATFFGVSELIIGLTIVALGTSLPEVVTSVMASLKGERDIAVGNVVGSNIFNILAVLGLTAIISPSGIEVSTAAITFDIPIMIAVAVACLPIFFIGSQISRWEGGVFFAYYIAYLLYIILGATKHSTLPMFESAMIYFILPLTTITLLVLVAAEFKNIKARKASKEIGN